VTCIENNEIADLIKGFVLENRRITVHEVSSMLGILFGSV